MTMLIRLVIVFVIFMNLTSAIGKSNWPYSFYHDSYISFSYPKGLYENLRPAGETIGNGKLRSYDLVRRGDNWDQVTICEDSLSSCAANDSQTSPYWLDADTRQLTIYDQTTIFVHRKIPGGDIYEGVALCPSTDNDGRSAAYGGECYVGVKTNGRRTFSLKYWIGPNENRAPNRSRTEEMDRARKLLKALGGPR